MEQHIIPTMQSQLQSLRPLKAAFLPGQQRALLHLTVKQASLILTNHHQKFPLLQHHQTVKENRHSLLKITQSSLNPCIPVCWKREKPQWTARRCNQTGSVDYAWTRTSQLFSYPVGICCFAVDALTAFGHVRNVTATFYSFRLYTYQSQPSPRNTPQAHLLYRLAQVSPQVLLGILNWRTCEQRGDFLLRSKPPITICILHFLHLTHI